MLKKVIALIMCIIFVTVTAISGSAWAFIGRKINGVPRKYINGINGRSYWINPGINWHDDIIVRAISSWNTTNSKFMFSRATTQSWSVLDFHIREMNNDQASAKTVYYGAKVNGQYPELKITGVSGEGLFIMENWHWCEVIMNTSAKATGDFMYPKPNESEAQRKKRLEIKQGIYAHEIGHTAGLAHVQTQRCIMYQGWNSRATIVPFTDDINGVVTLYGR
jgi:Predicted Zn-dependent proteases